MRRSSSVAAHALQAAEEAEVLRGGEVVEQRDLLGHETETALVPGLAAVVIGTPVSSTVPWSAAKMPAIIEMVVVLPAPFGPSSP